MAKVKIYKKLDGKFEELIENSFKELPKKPDEITKQYLVGVLTKFSDPKKIEKFDKPVALAYLKSKDISDKIEVGDGVLFMSGFFPEYLTKKGEGDLNYYMKIGKMAYDEVSQWVKMKVEELCRLYRELANNFEAYVDLFNKIKYNACEIWSEKDLILLFGKYLQTGNKNSLKILLDKGIRA